MEKYSIIDINGHSFKVKNDEFNIITNHRYNNLNISSSLGYYEKLVSLVSELSVLFNNPCILLNDISHGGYLPIKLEPYFNQIKCLYTEKDELDNFEFNIKGFNFNDIVRNKFKCVSEELTTELTTELKKVNIIVATNSTYIKQISDEIYYNNDIQNNIIITTDSISIFQIIKCNRYHMYTVKDTNLLLFVNMRSTIFEKFLNEFHYFIKDGSTLEYDNLIHLAIIVKNGGSEFEDMLKQNMHIIDRWTILDTGSTDNTIDIIKRNLIGRKKGNLYTEPFINFRDSRNRCLDLAGDSCKYILMLDDTYVIKGDLRRFLNTVRGDQFTDSFSLYIKSDDVEYVSNRIIKSSNKNLRYIFKIHEVITPENNKNVCIPIDDAHIYDIRSEYMENRTLKRKKYDLELLFEELEENPNEPRTYYYIAQTYNILNEYKLAYDYFVKRYEHNNNGFIQERIDSIFEAARLAEFKLNMDWEDCEKLYLKSYELDKSRPDSLYFIGMHYLLSKNKYKAYEYLKKAFEIGYPINSQYSLKPTISFYYVPKFLSELCYEFKDFECGLKSSILFLSKVDPKDEYYNTMLSWRNIFHILHNNRITNKTPFYDINSKPTLCIIADGGFSEWTGRDILTKGMGGSETFIVEIARYIQKSGKYNVIVFCRTTENDVFEDVVYRPINEMFDFFNNNRVRHCLISRYSEYIPYVYESHVENVYFILHDISPSGNVIPINKNKLRKIFCLTEWHVEYFTSLYPDLKSITRPFYYGIDIEKIEKYKCDIIPYKFIYTSFPNRGLLELLHIWPEIYKRYPKATLHLHTDLNGEWVNSVEGEKMKRIKNILKSISEENDDNMNIVYHGWTSKEDLYKSWYTSEIWLYPCNFAETFCLSAFEAAISRTVCISSNLAGLKNTIGDRGILIDGDTTKIEWKNNMIYALTSVLDNNEIKYNLIEKNYNFVKSFTWESRANCLMTEYLDKYDIDYIDMYNWTNDIPINTKEEFLNIIKYFNNLRNEYDIKRVLEIGVYTGTSIIAILENIPNSVGVAIDKWENYKELVSGVDYNITSNIHENHIQDIFLNNVKSRKLNDRIESIKGDSFEEMVKLLKRGEKFDFIYIDGSHLCMDCFTDLTIAWELLEYNGILAIDDYMFNSNQVLNSPYEAVNHFLEKYKNKYKMLSKNYRVFLLKIIQ